MARTKFGKWLDKTFNIGHAIRDNRGLGKVINQIAPKVGDALESYVNAQTGAGLTGAQKESAALSLKNQQILNEEDYQRKIDFYEQYESPSAQVRQYKDAGLNPALMFGNGASVSASGGIGAGSAPAPSPDGVDSLVGAISSLKSLELKKQQMYLDYSLQLDKNRIERDSVKNQGDWLRILGRKTEAETTGVQLNNDFLQETFLSRVQGAENESQLKANMSKNLVSLVESREYQNKLWDAQTGLTNAQKGLVSAETTGQMLQNAILRAQKNYADEYFSATAKLQTALWQYQSTQNTFLEKTLQARISQAEYELSHLIIRAGMDARVYNGEAFEKEVQGRMTHKEKVQFWTGAAQSAVKTAVTGAAAAYGAGMLGAGAAAAPAAAFGGTYALPVW